MSADDHVALWAEVVHAGHEGLVEFVSAVRRPDGALRMRPRDDEAQLPALPAARSAGRARPGGRRARGEEAFATPLARSAAVPGKKAALPGAGAVGRRRRRRATAREPDWVEALRPHLWVASGGGHARLLAP